MANDFATLLLALVMGYQLSAPLIETERVRHWARLVWPFLSLTVIALVPHVTLPGLRLGWLLSGLILTVSAWQGTGQRRSTRQYWVTCLDGAGTWLALVLAGSNPWAVASGAFSGMILPLGTGPWPDGLRRALEPVEWAFMGAVGLRTLLMATFGFKMERWPILLLVAPWLIAWDWRVRGGDSRLILPKQPRE